MTYDQWKTDSGYDEEPCDHWDTDIDWDSRIICERCGEFLRYATNAELEQNAEWEREYYEQMEREERRERFFRPWRWLKSLFARRKQHKPIDDEIPF